MKIALFLDTMIYLHYQRFDQIDWYDALSLGRHAEVTLVVPAVTLKEIDKKKNENPRLRDRAQRVTARFSSVPSSLCGGVALPVG